MMKNRQDKEPTFMSIVEKYLNEADDFVSLHQIMDGTGLNVNRVTACLCNMHGYAAANFMVEGGVSYWFATPETDRRTRKVEVKVREEEGSRKPRKGGGNNHGGGRRKKAVVESEQETLRRWQEAREKAEKEMLHRVHELGED